MQIRLATATLQQLGQIPGLPALYFPGSMKDPVIALNTRLSEPKFNPYSVLFANRLPTCQKNIPLLGRGRKTEKSIPLRWIFRSQTGQLIIGTQLEESPVTGSEENAPTATEVPASIVKFRS